MNPAMNTPETLRLPRRWLLPLLATGLVTGCTWQPPRAWEKGVLARPEMGMAGDPQARAFDQHIYTSKENASGGNGVGGGGCGCN